MIILFNFDCFKYIYINNNQKHHRLGGPCYENNNGSKWWYKNGDSGRENFAVNYLNIQYFVKK